jgi:hypothetical protein
VRWDDIRPIAPDRRRPGRNARERFRPEALAAGPWADSRPVRPRRSQAAYASESGSCGSGKAAEPAPASGLGFVRTGEPAPPSSASPRSSGTDERPVSMASLNMSRWRSSERSASRTSFRVALSDSHVSHRRLAPTRRSLDLSPMLPTESLASHAASSSCCRWADDFRGERRRSPDCVATVTAA